MKASERSAQVAALEERLEALERAKVEPMVADWTTETATLLLHKVGDLEGRVQALEAGHTREAVRPNGTGDRCWWAWAVAMLGAGVAALAAYEHMRQQQRTQQPLRRVQEGLAP